MRSFINPFISCTARDMSYSEVERFWCSPYECYRLDEITFNASSTPIIIEGARGSGKTMILKHHSFFCKKEKYVKGQYLDSIFRDGFLGIYFRYSADYGTLFDSLNCNSNFKERLFSNYFQLCIAIEIGKILSELEDELHENESRKLFSGFSKICGEKIEDSKSLIMYAERQIHNQDRIIRNSQYNKLVESDIPVVSLTIASITSTIHDAISNLKDTLFLIIIDEYENIGIYQRVINTYIKQMDGTDKYSYRIGVRPEGIVDYYTNIGEEFLQEGRDYLLMRLEVESRDRSARYRKFVEEVINRRLNTVPLFFQAGITIAQMLGRDEDYSWEAKYHTKGKQLKVNEFLGASGNSVAEIRETLYSDNPLVQAYYAMRIKRGASIQDIEQTKKELKEGKTTEFTKKYNLDMQGKYKAALLFWIIDKYKAEKLYYSLNTFVYLSCGSIYDFIGLCRTLFDELESDYYDNLEKSPMIPRETQNKAARRYALSQIEKVKLNHDYGVQMWHFAQNMCSLFSFFHKGDLCIKYPETNQFFIKGSFADNGVNKEIWKSLIKWGVVIRKTSYQRASASINGKSQLYYINKLYYPVFNISCRIRGGFNYALTDEVWNSIIISYVDPSELISTTRKKLNEVQTKDCHNQESPYKQYSMWDKGEN